MGATRESLHHGPNEAHCHILSGTLNWAHG